VRVQVNHGQINFLVLSYTDAGKLIDHDLLVPAQTGQTLCYGSIEYLYVQYSNRYINQTGDLQNTNQLCKEANT